MQTKVKNKTLFLKNCLISSDPELYNIKREIKNKKTKFQKAALADTCSLGKCFLLNDKLQSAELDEHIYNEALIHPAMITHGSVKEVLILGGGEGASIREVLKYKTLRRSVLIEKDREVLSFCKSYLKSWHQGSFNSPRCRLMITDPKTYIEHAEQKYDLIFSDLPSPEEDPSVFHLYTIEFYNKLKYRLRSGGILALQAGSGNILKLRFHTALYHTLKCLFRYTFPYFVYIPSFNSVWSFFFASNSKNPFSLNVKQINERISRLIKGRLSFYDGMTHIGLFNINKDIRSRIASNREIITKKKFIKFQ
ncbi:MAG: spermidine synthase [bacterium]